MFMVLRWIIGLLLFFSPFLSFGQQDSSALCLSGADSSLYRLTNEVAWLSVGHHHNYDDYLSQLLYQGTKVAAGFYQSRFYSPTFRRISKYDGLEFHFADDKNPSENYTLWFFDLRGYYGAHYHFYPFRNFSLQPGAFSNIDLGAKYIPHNTNNPVNVIGSANMWASLIATYKFSLGIYPIFLREHFSMAFFGCMFSPEYSQLYYDIASINGYDGNLYATSFSDYFRFRNEFSADFRIAALATVRLGVVAERLKYSVGNLNGRNLDVSFQIGIVRNFYTFKGNKHIPSNFINPLE